MIDRFLAAARPGRRHLEGLVALLVLTFSLTVVLVVRAHRTETARQEQAQAMLQDLVENAAVEWGHTLATWTPPALKWTLYRSLGTLLEAPDAALDVLAAQMEPHQLCSDCRSTLGEPTYFSIDFRSGAESYSGAGQRLTHALRSAIHANVQRRAWAPLHDLVGVALYHTVSQNDIETVAVALRHAPDGTPLRAVGYFVPAAMVRELSLLTFDNLELLLPSQKGGRSNSDVFSPRARVGPEWLIGPGHGRDMVVASASPDAVPTGITLEVGLTDEAAAGLLPRALSSGVPVLLGLLVAIAVLIVLALLLVRREAELVRLRADFISSVSHELRTPLAQIRMFTEALLMGRPRNDAERRRSLEIVQQETLRLGQLVENILQFSRSEGGRQPQLARVPVDFAGAIADAADSFAPLCRAKNTELRTELQERIVVPVDTGALRQIMVNLIDNALKYGRPGQRITVGAALFDDVARAWVDDEGPGIPFGERERIFESFYRMPRDIMSSSTGSGIGLAIVRELARLHGGTARAETAPGGGARLVVEFPEAYLRVEPPADLAAAS